MSMLSRLPPRDSERPDWQQLGKHRAQCVSAPKTNGVGVVTTLPTLLVENGYRVVG